MGILTIQKGVASKIFSVVWPSLSYVPDVNSAEVFFRGGGGTRRKTTISSNFPPWARLEGLFDIGIVFVRFSNSFTIRARA